MARINTRFNIKDRLYIKELKIWGRVLAIYISIKGIEYYIRYFNNAAPVDCYFLEEELQENEGEDKIGFTKC